jgi:hypothetical protein
MCSNSCVNFILFLCVYMHAAHVYIRTSTCLVHANHTLSVCIACACEVCVCTIVSVRMYVQCVGMYKTCTHAKKSC